LRNDEVRMEWEVEKIGIAMWKRRLHGCQRACEYRAMLALEEIGRKLAKIGVAIWKR
jgi:hypothetical protein